MPTIISNYPNVYDTFVSPNSTHKSNNATLKHSELHTLTNNSIEAIEATLGIHPEYGYSTVAERLAAIRGTLDALISGNNAAVTISASQVSISDGGNYFVSTNVEDALQYLAQIGGSGDTPAQILAKIITVDGVGSNLDADLFDGLNSTAFYQIGGTDVSIVDGGTGASTAAGARTNLGLGSMAIQNAPSVAITGGTITGITDLAVADGGTGASTAVAARINLGLRIGIDVAKQPAISILTPTTGAVAVDMVTADGDYLTHALSGDPIYSLTNRFAGATTSISIVSGASERTLTFPAGWVFVGIEPTTISANKVGVLTVTCFDTTDTGVLAAYSVQT